MAPEEAEAGPDSRSSAEEGDRYRICPFPVAVGVGFKDCDCSVRDSRTSVFHLNNSRERKVKRHPEE